MKEEGLSRIQAAKLGIGEVALPIIVSTATTIAAFIPLGTWPGIIGEFMIYFPITLSAILGSSLIVAIFFNSMLVSNFMTVEENELSNKNLYKATYFLGSIGIIFLIFSSTRIFGSLFLLITIFLWLYKIFLKKQIDKFKDKILPVLELSLIHISEPTRR